MKLPTYAADVVWEYEKTLNAFRYKNKYMGLYICKTNNEPCGNDRILHNVSIALRKVKECIHKINVILECFDYELNQYDAKSTRTEEEADDYDTVKSRRWQLFRILKSFIETHDFLSNIEKQCKEYRFPKNGTYEKAATYACKKHIERCKNCFHNVITDYIMSSILRPYYLYLKNNNINFLDDINKYFPIGNYMNHEQAHDKLKPYIQMIADFDPSCTSYKNARKEDRKRLDARQAAIEESKRAEREERQQLQYEEKLTKLATGIEQTILLKRNGIRKGTNWLLNNVSKHPDFSNSAKQGSVICCLIKPETGRSVIRYMTSKGLVSHPRDVDMFFFNDESLHETMEQCRSYENVKAVDSIRVF